MDSLKEVSRYLPGLMLWKKDINSVFLEMNDALAKSLGFKDPIAAQGLTDYEIPSPAVECAEAYRQQDKQIILSGRRLKAIEIVTDASNNRVILLSNKRPFYRNGKIAGTAGYTIDITQAFIELNAILHSIPGFSVTSSQASFSIGLEKTYDLNLNQAETLCLFYLVRGYSLNEIAHATLTEPTELKRYVHQLVQKFNCQNEIELINIAKEKGFMNNIPEQLFDANFSTRLLDNAFAEPKKEIEEI